ncbi:mannitol dehydrogenase family protein [Actinospica sp. MGRD01-02]|uniref:Mannitol-1-phosphate 5-dehydrogenase n=1 Tax=Actinospica acidithermotolerans TaxID=2828514 RepID=A0A941IHL0_9ACTN|nr:mannitol dehydrogenase family protein [Actinospica acidithermotolerans]MBR7827324.1 mannitol dehydrogenase family protein [Actinospica acidithermotolerans]
MPSYPTYDRSAVSVGIVHFGVGGFHRAHQAAYIDSLMAQGTAMDWGICGVGVKPADEAMARALVPQQCRYTLVTKHPDGKLEPRVIGSIVEYLYAPDDPERVLRVLTREQTRIVSLTITEGGYNFNQVTREFIADEPEVAADLVRGATPSTVFGYVVEALDRRRRGGIAPFTVMSCDNIQSNGHVAREMFTAFAALRDPELARWITEHVHFPDSMVDRITPATTDDDREQVREELGVVDNWPVICEPFTQWVLEDDFSLGRPPLELVGVQLVDDVAPYELMKLRLLNASHQAIAYFGHLLGHRYAHEAATDPRLKEFTRVYMDAEATPTLLPVPGVDLEAYKAELLERFANPGIRDTVARLCAESSDRIPKWVLPVIRQNLATGGPISHATAIVASWARYAEGVDEQGRTIEVVDRLADEVGAAARRYPEDPLAFVRMTQLFGDLAQDERFAREYLRLAASIHEVGVAETLAGLATSVDASAAER